VCPDPQPGVTAADINTVADEERLTASSREGAAVVKLACSDGRQLEVTDAEWRDLPPASPSTVTRTSASTAETCSGTDNRTAELFKLLCDGQYSLSRRRHRGAMSGVVQCRGDRRAGLVVSSLAACRCHRVVLPVSSTIIRC